MSPTPAARTGRAARTGDPAEGANEPVSSFHSASGGDRSADAGGVSGGRGGVLPDSGFGAAGGGVSDDPGADVLPRREPGGGGLGGDGAARAAVRAGRRAEPDDLDERGRRFGDHPAVSARAEHRRGGAGSAGGDQSGAELSAGEIGRASCREKCRSRWS